jgi:hypothetical protein
MVGSKLTCPKCHFGQIEHGDNWGIFWSNFLVEKTMFSCGETSYKQNTKLFQTIHDNIFNMHIHKIKTRGIINYESIKLNTNQN